MKEAPRDGRVLEEVKNKSLQYIPYFPSTLKK